MPIATYPLGIERIIDAAHDNRTALFSFGELLTLAAALDALDPRIGSMHFRAAELRDELRAELFRRSAEPERSR